MRLSVVVGVRIGTYGQAMLPISPIAEACPVLL